MDPCEHCEEVMQPYLDRTVSRRSRRGSRRTSRVPVVREAIPLRGGVPPLRPRRGRGADGAELKAKLAALRTPLLRTPDGPLRGGREVDT